MNEIWKPVKDYEGLYEVSNKGRIRSLQRTVLRSDGGIITVREKILHLHCNGDGYLQCKLCRNGHYKTVRVHALVAQAFVPNPKHLSEVNHIDTNRTNNYSENLEWASHVDNVRHSANMGHYKHFGPDNPNYHGTKLKEYFEKHPEAKATLSRKGSQNGTAKSVYVLIDGRRYNFSYLEACARFLMDSGYTRAKSVRGICDYISAAMKSGKCYLGLRFYRE